MRKEKQAEKNEIEMLLNEIPHATSPDHLTHDAVDDELHARLLAARGQIRDRFNGISPAHGGVHGYGYEYGFGGLDGYVANGHANGHVSLSPPLHSRGSSSSLSRTPSPTGEDAAVEALRLLDGLRAMRLGNEGELPIGRSPEAVSMFGNDPTFGSPIAAGYLSFPRRKPLFDDSAAYEVSAMERYSRSLASQQHSNLYSNLSRHWLSSRQSGAPILKPNGFSNGLSPEALNVTYPANGNFGRSYLDSGYPYEDRFTSVDQHFDSGVFSLPGNKWVDPGLGTDAPNSLSSQYEMYPKLHYSSPVLNRRERSFVEGWSPPSPPSLGGLDGVEAFNCEDTYLIQGRGLQFVRNNHLDLPREGKRLPSDARLLPRRIPAVDLDSVQSPRIQFSPIDQLRYDNLMDIEGNIYLMAKDQHGCRFLQRKFDEGKAQVDKIFNGTINHVVELMVNPFGNYLVQKLLDLCSEEQRMAIILVLAQHPGELVRISLNIHGTRAVQKLIETLKTRRQVALTISALQPGFLNLITDLNGNHVVQRCLLSLSVEDNKFIFDAAARHCVDIATHQHGCCVLQRCIASSSGEYQAKMMAEVSANGLLLAQDPYGNYVVQYILGIKNPSVIATLASQFKGNYVCLSTQKFSSNVVERCLKMFGENDRATIILELLSVSHFEQLVQDPFANYVILSALGTLKGPLHTALVDALLPHAAVLKTNPHCKRIYSRLLRK